MKGVMISSAEIKHVSHAYVFVVVISGVHPIFVFVFLHIVSMVNLPRTFIINNVFREPTGLSSFHFCVFCS